MWRLKLTTTCYCVFETKEHLRLKKYQRKAKPRLKLFENSLISMKKKGYLKERKKSVMLYL